MEVLRQIQIGAVRYRKGDVIDVKKLTKEQVEKMVHAGYLTDGKNKKGEK
ncbi:hypothetical protein [Wohlfahrtiimonas sp. G9077]|nr:hypothetical protein [Wohlfahrtiimonas sp. G9077]